jgi:hypothetical protein
LNTMQVLFNIVRKKNDCHNAYKDLKTHLICKIGRGSRELCR